MFQDDVIPAARTLFTKRTFASRICCCHLCDVASSETKRRAGSQPRNARLPRRRHSGSCASRRVSWKGEKSGGRRRRPRSALKAAEEARDRIQFRRLLLLLHRPCLPQRGRAARRGLLQQLPISGPRTPRPAVASVAGLPSPPSFSFVSTVAPLLVPRGIFGIEKRQRDKEEDAGGHRLDRRRATPSAALPAPAAPKNVREADVNRSVARRPSPVRPRPAPIRAPLLAHQQHRTSWPSSPSPGDLRLRPAS